MFRSSKDIYYGIDAPNMIGNLLLVAFLAAAGFFVAPLFLTDKILFFAQVSLIGYVVCGIIPVCYMLFSSLKGKVLQRDKLLQSLDLQGDETILDIGSGRGLYAIGAAELLTSGKVVAVDIWQSYDLTGNSPEALRNNAELAGVADRIEIVTADARELPFPDGMFDVVVSSFMIHNITDEQGREKALAQMMRVLKPGGVLLLQDFKYGYDCAVYLDDHGMLAVDLGSPQFLLFPCGRVVRATKPL